MYKLCGWPPLKDSYYELETTGHLRDRYKHVYEVVLYKGFKPNTLGILYNIRRF